LNIQQTLRLENGGTIWLPPSPNFPNTNIPDLSKTDSAQQYDIGCAYTYNGKAYYYAYVTAAVEGGMAACKSYKQEVSYQLIGAAADQYATSITITVGATDGIAAGGVVAKDYLKGGSVQVFTGTTTQFTRGIISNAAVAANGGTCVLELDGAIPAALTTSMYAEATSSPWSAVLDSTAAWMPKVGLATCYAAASKYVWLQTWGQCWVTSQANIGTAGYHHAIFKHDGSIEKITTVDLNHSDQYAGWTFSWGAGGAQAAPFVFLMIAHP